MKKPTHYYYYNKVLGVQHFPRALCGYGEPINRIKTTHFKHEVTCQACKDKL